MSHFEIKRPARFFKICIGFIFAVFFVQASIAKAVVIFPNSRAPAAINQAVLVQVNPEQVFSSENGKPISPDLIANYNQVKALEQPLDVTQLIPMDLSPTRDSSEVFSRVADKSATTYFNSPAVRATSLGQSATSVEKSLKQEIIFGRNPSVQHKLNFNFQAFQSLAQMQYSGITNAAVKYKANESKLALEIFEKLRGGKDLVLSHTISPADRVSQVSLRWKF